MPSVVRALWEVDRKVPPRAVLWLVSTVEPKDWVYFLYPRLVAKGSQRMEDLPSVRRRHPGDWVMTNHSLDPAQDTLDLWPPLPAPAPVRVREIP